MPRSRARCLPFVGLIAAVFAPAARADDPAVAQKLFDEARALAAAGRTAEACPKFERAAELSHTAGVRLNLSDCWAKLGRVASAWAKANEALAIAERAGETAAADAARQRKSALDPRLSYLTVTVPAEARVGGLEIARDGEKVPEAAWGTAVPVDPGDHEVRAIAPGHKAWAQKRAVAGERVRVTLTVPTLQTEPATSTSTPTSTGTETGNGGGLRTAGLAAAALGVVGLGAGAWFGARVLSKKHAYEDHSDAAGRCVDAECETLSGEARAAGNVATVGLVADAAALWSTRTARTGTAGTDRGAATEAAGARSETPAASSSPSSFAGAIAAAPGSGTSFAGVVTASAAQRPAAPVDSVAPASPTRPRAEATATPKPAPAKTEPRKLEPKKPGPSGYDPLGHL